MEIMNDVKNHLSQYPYISYSDHNNIITFNKNISLNYLTGIISPFNYNVLSENPVQVEIVGKNTSIDGKIILSTVEPVLLYDFGVEIDAKIDTGADMSSLHCTNINIDKNEEKVSFILLDKTYDQYTGKKFIFDIYDFVDVQSSNGDIAKRPIICTEIAIKDETMIAYITLTDRSKMEYGMLIGTDISSKFVIAPSKI
jgi:hypothetical protein